MLCEACQKHTASVHLTDVSNDTKKEVHLCEECARSQGVTIKSYMHKQPAVSAPQLVSQVLESAVESAGGPGTLRCPRCKTTYRQFRSTGKFGCPHDYAVFKPKLVDLLEKIHGHSQHAGKVPLRAGNQIAREKELRALRGELEKAVQEEAYEQAAELRDRIQRLEGR